MIERQSDFRRRSHVHLMSRHYFGGAGVSTAIGFGASPRAPSAGGGAATPAAGPAAPVGAAQPQAVGAGAQQVGAGAQQVGAGAQQVGAGAAQTGAAGAQQLGAGAGAQQDGAASQHRLRLTLRTFTLRVLQQELQELSPQPETTTGAAQPLLRENKPASTDVAAMSSATAAKAIPRTIIHLLEQTPGSICKTTRRVRHRAAAVIMLSSVGV